MSRRGLFFYPHNFFALSSGSHRRAFDLAEYFRDRKIAVDLISLDGFSNTWDEGSLEKARSFFENISICPWRPSLWTRFKLRVPAVRDRSLLNFSSPALVRMLQSRLAANKYHFFLNSYAYWHDLVDGVDEGITTIMDMHDLITLNHHCQTGSRGFRLGRMLQQEINALDKYDYCLSISEEEALLLQPFCNHTRFIDLPISFEARFRASELSYDVVTVGSDNPFNRKGIQWFMNDVYPLLPATLSIAIVGGMANAVEKRQNVLCIPHADALDDIYRKARVVFCPVLSGTGLKIKVVEALSFGRPVVTTSAGLAGILQKKHNGCLVADEPHQFARSITSLLTDQNLYDAFAEEGKSLFLKKFTRAVCWPKLDSILLPA